MNVSRAWNWKEVFGRLPRSGVRFGDRHEETAEKAPAEKASAPSTTIKASWEKAFELAKERS